ncbi:MAG: hypothetical protein HY289_14350, partial [Planctomycetes bacterium]|nr:hypothetical protein [Planctomycetota bacterium]
MLSEKDTELLTAFVDGELAPLQREEAMRLLNQSSEARTLLRDLQENAHRVKQLPPRKVEPGLVEEILQAIAEHKAQPKPATRGTRRRWLPYVAASLAASLLIAVFGLIFWKTMNHPDVIKDDTGIAKNENDKKPDPQPPVLPPTRKPNPALGPLVDGAFSGFAKAIPVDPPFASAFRDLQTGKTTGQFAHAVDREKDKLVHLDISVESNPKAIERLREVLQNHKIDLVVDPGAVKPIEDKKVEYIVYADNLTSDELTRMMAKLGEKVVVGKGNTEIKVPSPYQKVTVKPVAKDEKQKLASMLGVEPEAVIPPGQAKKLNGNRMHEPA